MGIQISHLISHSSPPVFTQPLPNPPPIKLPKEATLPLPLPLIVLYNFSSHTPVEGFEIYSPIHQQPTDDDQDIFISDNNYIPDHTDSSMYNQTNSSAFDQTNPSADDYPNYSGSDVSTSLPLASDPPTEASSAMPSDSDLPPPSLHPSKPPRQADLLNSFSVIPSGEAHTTWTKRKRDN